MEQRPKVHVCSLSLSALRTVSRDLDNFMRQYNASAGISPQEKTRMGFELQRLRWCQLSMEYNQHQQLQYIYQFNGDKAANPEFRKIKLRSVFRFWKREKLRSIWKQVHEEVLKKNIDSRVNNKNDYFMRQRALLSARSFVKGLNFYTVPVEDLVPIDLIKAIDCFQCPESANFGWENRERGFCESDAVKDFSSDNETETTMNTFEMNYREQFISRAVAPGGAVPFKTRNLDMDSESEDIFVLHVDNQQKSVKNAPSIDSESEGKIDDEIVVVQPIEENIEEEKKTEEVVKVQKSEPAPASNRKLYLSLIAVGIVIILIFAVLFFRGNVSTLEPVSTVAPVDPAPEE